MVDYMYEVTAWDGYRTLTYKTKDIIDAMRCLQNVWNKIDGDIDLIGCRTGEILFSYHHHEVYVSVEFRLVWENFCSHLD